jgi:hypothetical protein
VARAGHADQRDDGWLGSEVVLQARAPAQASRSVTA